MKATYYLLFVSLLLSFGCVSKRKYDDLNVKKSGLEVDKAELADQVKLSEAENQRLTTSVEDYRQQVDELTNDTTELANLYKDLITQYTGLTKTSTADAQKLSKQLDKVAQLSKELAKKDAALAHDQREIEKLSLDLEAREKRVEELEQIVSQLENASKDLKNKISEALLGFKENDLSVEIKDGNIYVSLAEDLLFKSGSYSIDAKGKSALKKIADVLKTQEDITIVVEGHTDDVPYRSSGVLKDNWDLSVMRATSIVKELTSTGLKPEMVAASGRGEFVPKLDEDTREARAKNRRSEIIISPNLGELFKLLDQEK